MSLQPVQESK